MGRKAIVAGAGPVGALAATLLAQQGYTVEVYERRACPAKLPPLSDSRAYLLNLNVRAAKAFQAAGICLDELVLRCNGRAEFQFRDAKGRPIGGVSQPVTLQDPTRVRVFRDELSRHLIDEAQRLHPQSISFHFEAPVTSLDFQKRIATISGSQEVQYDLLIGADGGGSTVRAELQKIMPPEFVNRRTHTAVFATGPLHMDHPDQFPQHTFTTMDAFEAGSVMVYGRGNGDYRIGLFIDAAGAKKLRSGDDAWLQKLLDVSMPKLLDDARKSAKRLAANPPEFASVSGWTSLSQLHGPHVVLLGDAAHTMTPVLGQGCNSGLEDVHILAKLLAETPELENALSLYTKQRLPDVRALVQLNEFAAYERFETGLLSSEQLLHKLWIQLNSALLGTQPLRMLLAKMAPTVFAKPALFQALTTDLPYRKVMPAIYCDAAFLLSLLFAVCGLLYYALLRN